MPSGLPDAYGVEEFASSLVPKWCAFEGVAHLKIETEEFPKLDFERIPQKKSKEQEPLTRQKYWRQQYKLAPYLRKLSKEHLLQHGEKLLEDIGSRVLKGAPRTPKPEMLEIMERFTHFLEEVNFRAIDMRELKADGLKERLEALYDKYQRDSVDVPPKSRTTRKRASKAYKNKIGRGAPCPCQSGRLYRRCCGAQTHTIESATDS